MSEIISWSGYQWLTRERWGSIHPYKQWNWYDQSAIEIDNANRLKLQIHHNPREFTLPADEYFPERKVISKWGIGIITCETEFSYGLFSIEAKLPKGRGIWPAFWMYDPANPSGQALPEVDILEAYSGAGDYRNGWLHPYRIENGLHIERNLGLKKFRARSPWIWQFNSNPSDGFHRYQFLWMPDRMEFRIDGCSVRNITDRKIMNYCAGRRLIVLLNTHIDGRYQTDFGIDPKNPFMINYFNYLPNG
jgi:hypothetical protein